MNNIQKLIAELMIEKLKAQRLADRFRHNNLIVSNNQGVLWAFDLCIQKLELLLSDKPTGAITEAAHSANTMLGEVCPHCGKLLTAESSGADSSETGDVRQNLGQLKDGGTTDG